MVRKLVALLGQPVLELFEGDGAAVVLVDALEHLLEPLDLLL